MGPHGNFKVELINSVVHAFPSGGFNERGVIELRKEILRIAPLDSSWILVEHPKDLAGLTPDALTELIKTYQVVSAHNCKAIALEINTTWHKIIKAHIKDSLDIPLYLSDDLESINDFLKDC